MQGSRQGCCWCLGACHNYRCHRRDYSLVNTIQAYRYSTKPLSYALSIIEFIKTTLCRKIFLFPSSGEYDTKEIVLCWAAPYDMRLTVPWNPINSVHNPTLLTLRQKEKEFPKRKDSDILPLAVQAATHTAVLNKLPSEGGDSLIQVSCGWWTERWIRVCLDVGYTAGEGQQQITALLS